MNRILDWFRSLTSTRPPLPEAGRNDPCPCGSGKKFKNCCIEKFEQEKLARTAAGIGTRSGAAYRAIERMKKRR